MMSKGKVKWYNEAKGFGFIEIEDDKDIFVHRTGLDSPYAGLNPGDSVSFDIQEGQVGQVAKNVKLI